MLYNDGHTALLNVKYFRCINKSSKYFAAGDSVSHFRLALSNVARRTEGGVYDSHQGIGRGATAPQYADHDENPAVDSLPERQSSEATSTLYIVVRM